MKLLLLLISFLSFNCVSKRALKTTDILSITKEKKEFISKHESYKHFLFRANIEVGTPGWEDRALMWYEHTNALFIYFPSVIKKRDKKISIDKSKKIININTNDSDIFESEFEIALNKADSIVITRPPDEMLLSIFNVLLKAVEKMKENQVIIFPDWDWRDGQTSKFISYLESTYYDGQSEHLSKIQCWKNETPDSMKFLIFHSGGYLSKEFREYYWTENEARSFIIEPTEKGLFKYRLPDMNGRKTLVNGCGKFVQKKNGCIYFAAWPIDLGIQHVRHSFLSQGLPVINAGYAHFKNGKLECMDNWTGHYQSQSMNLTSKYLKEFNIELKTCKVQEQIETCGTLNPPLRIPTHH